MHNTIRMWLAEGCEPEIDIIGTVRDVMAKRIARGDTEPPGSFAYFTKAVFRTKAERLAAKSGNQVGKDDPRAPAGGWSEAHKQRNIRIVELKFLLKTGKWLPELGPRPTPELAQKELEKLETLQKADYRPADEI